MNPDHYDDLIRGVVAGRKIVVCADVLVGAWAQAKTMRALGAKRPFLIAGTLGTGELPTEADAEWFMLHTAGDTMMEGIRRFESALDDPPPELAAALDRYDPQREALVIGTIFMREGDHLGRRTYGTRLRAWEALEDKIVIDDVFDAVGIPRAPREIVAADAGAIRAAHDRLDQGAGTALAGDATAGWWGGAEFFRWARTDNDLRDATAFFAGTCDRVRVMPFLEGIPCSVHGMVFDDTVIVFRPVEMVTLRRPDASRLLYAGIATFWDPPDARREEMRDTARRLGAHLREQVDYRGLFTLDGVMTIDGFRPTEVNARAGAGITPLALASGVNLPFLSRMVTEGDTADLRPAELEALVVERADALRRGACYTVIDLPIDQTQEHAVTIDDLPGQVLLGPSGVGGFVRFTPEFAAVRIGGSFAPIAVSAFAYTDEHFQTGIGEVGAATDVR